MLGYSLYVIGTTLGVYGTLPAIRELFVFAPILASWQPTRRLCHVTEEKL